MQHNISYPHCALCRRPILNNNHHVLLHYFLWQSLNVPVREHLPLLTHWLHAEQGNRCTKLSCSAFYRRLRYAPNYNNDKQLIKDLTFLEGYCQDHGLNELMPLLVEEKEQAYLASSRYPPKKCNKNVLI